MDHDTFCGSCGTRLAVDLANCPHCLLRLGLDLPARDPEATASLSHPDAAAQGALRSAADKQSLPGIEAIAARFPQLEILELIGQGGMGIVYKARQRKLDRLVALKILALGADRQPGFADRFLREARAMARLTHPHIVAVYDFGETDGMCWLLMELVDGVTLRQALNSGALMPEGALKIVPQVCEALQCAHDLGVVHRDIKPENVLLDRRGNVKIADFGLAKLMGQTAADPTLTRSEQVMGTPHYMAPEQMHASRDVDHRADIFSLGVVFYEMLTGRLPIGNFEPPSGRAALDTRIDDIVMRALAHEPERRYQHAAEVKTAVEGLTRAPAAASAPSRPLLRLGGKLGLVPRRALLLLGCLAAFEGAWLAVQAMWRTGAAGMALFAIGALVLAHWLLRAMIAAQPELDQALSQSRPWVRPLRLVGALAALPAVVLLGLGIVTFWEVKAADYARGPLMGERGFWSVDWERRVAVLMESVLDLGPTTKLGPARHDWSLASEQWSEDEIAGCLVGSVVLLLLAATARVLTRRHWRSWERCWRPVLVGGLLIPGWTLYCVVASKLAGGDEPIYVAVQDRVPCRMTVDGAREQIADCLESYRYQEYAAIDLMYADPVSKEPRVRYDRIYAEPRSVFARWRLSDKGPRRLRPHLIIELVGKSGGACELLWHAGVLPANDGRGDAWRSDIDEMLSSLVAERTSK